MAQLLDNVLDSLQQKLETQLDSAVGIDLKTDRETESDEDEPGDVKALRARVRKAESDAKALLDEGADLSTKLGRSEQRNKTLRAELADRERVIARLESRGPPVDDGEERARLEGEAASLEARAASLELENGSLKRLAAASAETRDKLAKTERLLAAAISERDASRADAAAARRENAAAVREPPAEFLCAITRECMVDPVIAPDGFSYERSAIERWFRAKRTSPQTNAPLASTALVPNIALRGLIEGFHEGR